MLKLKIKALVLFGFSLTFGNAQNAKPIEEYRPKVHFTPQKNWMNDPNGMFYYKGEYHLFYQYNPYGNVWGHMSWGHAISKDLVKWEHLPIALEEENKTMIFSGSAVVDYNNTSGFGSLMSPPIVAIYTSYDAATGLQHQSIAYSNDNARTFTKYSNNPVLNLNSKDFRDPKVFWDENNKNWVMIVAMSMEKKILFYSSPNLKDWTKMSEFGSKGITEGVWECPDLFPLSYKGKTKWILTVNLGNGNISGGSGIHYFIGDFDGKNYVLDGTETSSGLEYQFLDYGKDFYAAVTWAGIPNQTTQSRKWLGWMNNWQYAADIPSLGWRGSMTIPRNLYLDKDDAGYLLRQEPINLSESYVKDLSKKSKKISIDQVNMIFKNHNSFDLTFDLSFSFFPNKSNGDLVFQILDDDKVSIRLSYNSNSENWTLIRKDKELNKQEYQTVQTLYETSSNSKKRKNVRIIVDKNSIELFLDNGKKVATNLFFPNTNKTTRVELQSENPIFELLDFSLHKFK
ncbi:glycoside hydrolase family 32 protein [Flavobacterium sp.]|uniref:glycoside hydrolase family 32 protein n=1 Tax=Flavobacterium sp. TaxID=239 RepID=UPI00286F632B|nr:glycoside hydrolase family 32 protein [Flavobacterium sp.]